MGKKILHFLDANLELIIGSICLALMVIFTLSNIILRLIFKSTLPWFQELTRYLFVWMVFISIGAVTREKGQIRITFLQSFLKGKTVHYVEIFTYVVSVIFGAIMFYYAVPLIGSLGDMRASSMQWFKMSYMYMVLPLGFASFVIRNIQMIVLEIMDMKKEAAGGTLDKEKGGEK